MIAPRASLDVRSIGAEGPLHLSFVAGSSKRLVVSFAGVGTQRAVVPPPEFAVLAHWNGENNVIFVSDLSRCWMNHDGMIEFVVDAVSAVAEQIGAEEICAVGNSMGGTAAMILASKMDIDTVVAITPQYSMHPDEVPEETRWTFFRDKITDWPHRTVPDLRESGSQVTIIHGGTLDELVHADRFPMDAGYRHYIFPEYGHKVARGLHDAGHLAPIVTLGILGRDLRVRRSVRAAGGMSRLRFEQVRETLSLRRH